MLNALISIFLPRLPNTRNSSKTPINSLPIESLIRVLELAGQHDVLFTGEHGVLHLELKAHKKVLRTLAAASLVARRWREPAQALMWL